MNAPLFIAGMLAFAIGVVHSALGEKYVVVPLCGENCPPLGKSRTFMRQIIRFGWHLTTVLFWGFAALLINMSLASRGILTARAIVGWTFFAAAVVSVVGTKGKHYSWVVFAVIAGLVLLSGPQV